MLGKVVIGVIFLLAGRVRPLDLEKTRHNDRMSVVGSGHDALCPYGNTINLIVLPTPNHVEVVK